MYYLITVHIGDEKIIYKTYNKAETCKILNKIIFKYEYINCEIEIKYNDNICTI